MPTFPDETSGPYRACLAAAGSAVEAVRVVRGRAVVETVQAALGRSAARLLAIQLNRAFEAGYRAGLQDAKLCQNVKSSKKDGLRA